MLCEQYIITMQALWIAGKMFRSFSKFFMEPDSPYSSKSNSLCAQ